MLDYFTQTGVCRGFLEPLSVCVSVAVVKTCGILSAVPKTTVLHFILGDKWQYGCATAIDWVVLIRIVNFSMEKFYIPHC